MTSELDHVLLTEATKDIERTKARQYAVTNYSAAVSAGLVGITKLFTDDGIAEPPLYDLVFYGIVANAGISVLMQANLSWSLTRFRLRAREIRKRLGLEATSVMRKTGRDLPLFLFFFAVPIFGGYVAALYLLRRSGLELIDFFRWWPF